MVFRLTWPKKTAMEPALPDANKGPCGKLPKGPSEGFLHPVPTLTQLILP
jgi:hypothetical protein